MKRINMNQFINKLPIKIKLMIIIMLTSIISLLITGAAFIILNKYYAKQNLIKNISAISMLIASRSTAAVSLQDYPFAEENLSALSIKPDVVAAYILNDSGSVIARYNTFSGRDLSPPVKFKNDNYYFDNNHLMLFKSIILDGKKIGTVFICASLDELYQQQRNIVLIVIVIIFFATLIAFFFSSRLQVFVSKPLLHLTETARIISQQNDYSLRAVRNSDDEIGILISAFNDMIQVIDSQNKDRKKLISDLRVSSSMLSTILDTIPQSIYWKDIHGFYLGCNRSYANYAGLKNQDSIIGKTANDLPWTRDKFEEFLAEDREVISTGKPKNHNIIHLTNAYGNIMWVDSNKIPLFDSDGNVNGILGFLEDITERKQAEIILRENEKRYKQLLESITDYTYSVTIVNKQPVNTIHSPGCETVTGFTPAEFIANPRLWIQMVHPDESKFVEHYADPLCQGIEIPILEHRIIHKNGSVIWIKNTYVLKYDADRKVIGYDGLITDITVRKKAEIELKLNRDNLEEIVKLRTAQLELEKEHALSADRIKSAFLASMSHELRTPLNSIIGFTGILMQERPGQLNAEQKKQLGMVQNSARHLLSLINDVLDISKIEADQLKVNYEEFNLPDIILDVVEISNPLAQKKNLQINVCIAPDVNHIKSDKLRVHQILLNLVNNAVKFTENGSVKIDAFLKNQSVIIKIIDSGIGIEKDKIEQLFKPFMQIDTGLARKHEGTGLGLSICKKLLSLLNGTIEVESEYGVGCTFSISLPIKKE
jgi:PAS domain S-box-containing protein